MEKVSVTMFSNKIVVITGASSGIGEAAAKILAKSGAIVVGLSRRMDKLDEIAALLPEHHFHPRYCDLSKEEEIVDAIAWAITKFGTIDILINNAGVCESVSLIDGSTKKWKRMIDINLMGVSIVTREVLKIMRLNDAGHILNINSIAGHVVPRFKRFPVGMYSATKFAVTALTEALRFELQELGNQIRVSSISPGNVFTEMHLKINGAEDVAENIEPGTEVPEDFLTADEVATSILSILMTPPNITIRDLKIQSSRQQTP